MLWSLFPLSGGNTPVPVTDTPELRNIKLRHFGQLNFLNKWKNGIILLNGRRIFPCTAHWDDGGGRTLLGDNTGDGGGYSAAVEVPVCWSLDFIRTRVCACVHLRILQLTVRVRILLYDLSKIRHVRDVPDRNCGVSRWSACAKKVWWVSEPVWMCGQGEILPLPGMESRTVLEGQCTSIYVVYNLTNTTVKWPLK